MLAKPITYSCAFLLFVLSSLPNASAAELKPDAVDFFEKKVRPLLVAKCYECHSAEAKQSGELMLDTRAGWEMGGESGPAIVPGEPGDSLLVEAVKYEGLEMPPDEQLSEDEITIFVKWVELGAPDPRTKGGPKAPRTIELEEGRKYWAFQSPQKTDPPQVTKSDWPYSDTDRFLLADQEESGVAPVADADRLSLIRRVTFDLTGLPPTPEEVEAFVHDPAATQKALEKLIDRLLGSPHYGERWGRHWLDVARYADSLGSTPLKYAWQYRDYVIESFNADKPFDQFIKEQVAGDLLPADDDEQQDQLVIATGFLALGERNDGQRDEVIDEQIDTTTKAFMALTLACARCHDHKFDPIPTEDYYAVAGIFRSTEVQRSGVNKKTPRPLNGADPKKHLQFEQKLEAHRKGVLRKKQDAQRAHDRFARNVRTIENRYRGKPSDKPRPDLQRAKQQLEQADKKLAAVVKQYEAAVQELKKLEQPMACAVVESKKIADQPLYVRGDRQNRGDVVPRGFIQVCTRSGSHLVENKKQSGRLELANWIASRDNPLTARAIVNRVWHHLFGVGIVPTVDNFGTLGQPPSHPKLLDYLAVQFMEDGWSIKRLIRRIVLSHAYQLSTQGDPENEQVDGDNHLVWRMNRRRLEAETIRDAILTFSGRLDLEPPAGGQFVQLANARANFDIPHRSVYLPVMREGGYDLFASFDGADPTMVMGRREVSTVPTQALYLLNSPLVVDESQHAAQRLLSRDDLDDAARIDLAYRLALCRPCTDNEQQWVLEFLDRYPQVIKDEGKYVKDARLEAWTRFCQSLIASAEFQILN